MKIDYVFWKLFFGLKLRINQRWINSKFNYLCYVNNVNKGADVKVFDSCPQIVTTGNARICIGNNVAIRGFGSTSWYCGTKIVAKQDAVVTISDHVGLNGVEIISHSSIFIGKHVHVGGGTLIFDTDFHSLNYLDRRDLSKDCSMAVTAPVVIEDDVFIGTHVIIGKGVRVGARSIIAAGSVVVKDIPEDCIAGGNPCKVIKKINQDG